ncbi:MULTISPECIES: winged helix-turn-helix transcriptional regulator [unclassified Streptomyces]|uniref:winged helix-turn-helix transcriptional regulator n=1 Tax=unclassified Streptomyces TaxID=2593676 RepID=UPI002E2A3ACA|nr:helix-turn-helix domain-containing protein [Streptomyces sp. NBC_01439]
MLARDYETQVCSIARALEVIGERWSLLIVRSVMQGHRRFDALQGELGITRSVLTDRLRRLEAEGVLERRPYQTRPERFDYVLTAKGLALWPALNHLMQWGDRYYPEVDGPPVVIEHTGCGGGPDTHQLCDRCGARLGPTNITSRPGRTTRP